MIIRYIILQLRYITLQLRYIILQLRYITLQLRYIILQLRYNITIIQLQFYLHLYLEHQKIEIFNSVLFNQFY